MQTKEEDRQEIAERMAAISEEIAERMAAINEALDEYDKTRDALIDAQENADAAYLKLRSLMNAERFGDANRRHGCPRGWDGR